MDSHRVLQGRGVSRVRSFASRSLIRFSCASVLSIGLIASGEAGAQTLPPGWTATNIGNPAIQGSATQVSCTSAGSTCLGFSVKAAGTNITGSSDQFTFINTRLDGDGAIIARVRDLQNTHPFAKAGVMIRETLSSSSENAFALVSPSNGVDFQWRSQTGGNTSRTNGSSAAAPVWVKVERAGNVFTAYESQDGLIWTDIGSQTITMPATVYAGVAVTSRDASEQTTATFTSVSIDTTLPTGWSFADVGSTAPAGGAAYLDGSFGVAGGGSQVGGTADQFSYAYRTLSGDVDIIARLADIDGGTAATVAGIMIRGSLEAGAANGFLQVAGDRDLTFQGRAQANGSTATVVSGVGTIPAWLKLERRGAVVSAFKSSDGAQWTLLGTLSTGLPSTVYLGLATNSHDRTSLATAIFDQVTVRQAVVPNVKPVVTLTSPAGGASFTAPAAVTMSATATDSDGTIARVDFYNGSTVVGSDTSAPYSFQWSNVAAGSYTVSAVAVDDDGATTASATASISVTAAPSGGGGGTSLPTDWSASDVGSPTLAGTTSFASATYTVEGAGIDIWDTSDQFRYVYKQMTGDFDLVARVTSLENTDPWAKAGLMIRSTMTASSAHASLIVTPSQGVAFQRRTSTAGSSVHTSGGAGAAPVWLKLQRRGQTITAFRSADGSTWSQVGTETLTLPSSFYAGIAVTSHNAGTRATATFTNVSASAASSPANQPPAVSLTSPAAGATFTAPASVTLTATASDSDGTVSKVEFYQGTTLVGTATASPYSVTWSNVAAGAYSLTAVATDDDGGKTTSAARSISVSAVANLAPSVSLTAPAAGASFTAPASITVTATASDTDGTVTKVDFYAGTQLIGTDTSSPYSITWSNVAAGSYSLTARATDTAGGTATSAARSISVTAATTTRKAIFTPSSDHATLVQRYVFEVFAAGANPSTATPLRTQDLGKPSITNGECSADITQTFSQLAAGNYAASGIL